MLERDSRDLKAWTRRSAAGTSLRPPRPPLVNGVRRAQVMTISSGDFARMDSRPRGMSASEEERWDWNWERRCCADGCHLLAGIYEKIWWVFAHLSTSWM